MKVVAALFGIFLILCLSEFSEGNIRCYGCNSLIEPGCDTAKNVPTVICNACMRQTSKSKDGSKIVVYRGCDQWNGQCNPYLEDENDCVSCHTELCNSADSFNGNISKFVVMLILGATVFRYAF